MTRRSLSSRTVQIVREDVSAMIRRVATRVHERHEAALQRQREAESYYQYEGNEVIVCLVRRVSEGRFVASTCTEIGKAGIVSTQPDEDRFLESSMRMQLMKAYYVSGHGKWEDCRERAAKVRIIIERSFALGSAANGGVR